jgi:exodeoxyribonuclease V beta subunit
MALLSSSEPNRPKSAHDLLEGVNAALPRFSVKEAFVEVRPHYKGMTAQEFEKQAALLDQAVSRGSLTKEEFDELIGEDKVWLEQISLENLKVKSTYGGHKDVALLKEALIPALKEARHSSQIFKLLSYHWHQERKRLCHLFETVEPDDILEKVYEKLAVIAPKVQNQYKAIIVDEFQDTDPLQWKIFSKLFFEDETKAVYLVGDPKQSIYAFRKADIYTFLSASHLFTQTASLATNYRSTSGLIDHLNSLFSKAPWLSLPRLNQLLPVPAVQAATQGSGDFRFLKVPGKPSPEMEERYLLPFIVHQLSTVQPKDVAILVKDRFQATRVQTYLEKWNVPSILLRKAPLGDSVAVEVLEEFAQAFLSTAWLKKFLLGPLTKVPIHELTEERVFQEKEQMEALLTLWQKEGLLSCMANFCYEGEVAEVLEKVGHAFSPEHLLEELKRLRKEERKDRISADEQGVQIMTIHASKGLEFDTVLALGVAWPSESEDEELKAEQLRQFYVALTRAKRGLYIPLPEECEDSPLATFLQTAKPDLEAFPITDLATFSFELKRFETALTAQTAPTPSPSFPPLFLQSFSTLAKPSLPKKAPAELLPSSAETGSLIHTILESLWDPNLFHIISQTARSTHLEGHESLVYDLLQKLLDLPLAGFTLRDIAPDKTLFEMEFLFPQNGAMIKGFIDLFFEHQGVYYLIDWKTNALDDYSQASLEEAMKAHDYLLQGELYMEAMKRYLNLFHAPSFGGIFFVFIRGPAAYHLEVPRGRP